MSKHNRERRAFRRLLKRETALNPYFKLTPYQQTRISKHGKRKLA